MKEEYEVPGVEKTGFNCPHCEAYTEQKWYFQFIGKKLSENSRSSMHLYDLRAAHCIRCGKYSIWIDLGFFTDSKNPINKFIMVFPNKSKVEKPNHDLPESIKKDYNEARFILNKSPRGAAALLRMCIENLCKHFGLTGKNLNKDIGELVKMGVPQSIQRALDSVRVIGNEAVHPGQIDLKDDQETASKLFHIINIIAYRMITEKKEIDDLFNKIPNGAKQQIIKRDTKNKK